MTAPKYPCTKCGGTGQFRNFGKCAKCGGKGGWATSPETREYNRKAGAERRARQAQATNMHSKVFSIVKLAAENGHDGSRRMMDDHKNGKAWSAAQISVARNLRLADTHGGMLRRKHDDSGLIDKGE